MGGEEGAVDSIVDGAVEDVGGSDMMEGSDDVRAGEEGDGVGGREDCEVKVDTDEIGVVSVGLGEGKGGGMGAVEGFKTGVVTSGVLPTGEVVTTSGGRSEVGAGGIRSTGRGMPVA